MGRFRRRDAACDRVYEWRAPRWPCAAHGDGRFFFERAYNNTPMTPAPILQMETPDEIQTLVRAVGSERDFDTRAAYAAYALYNTCFPEVPPVTVRAIRANRSTRAAWIEDGVAATLLAERFDKKDRGAIYYRVMGLAVAPAHRRRGHAAALMRRLETLVPAGAVIELGVDKGRPSTDWLLAWYTARLGYAPHSEDATEAVLRKRV